MNELLTKFVVFIVFLMLFSINVFADSWLPSKASHGTLYVDTITSKVDNSYVYIADTPGLYVTTDIITLGNVEVGGVITIKTLSANPRLWLQSTGTPDNVIIGVLDPSGSSTSGILIDNINDAANTADIHLNTRTSGNALTVKDSGKVGIGTTSPSQLLELHTAAAGNPILLELEKTSATVRRYGFGISSGGELFFQDISGGADRITVQTDGDVIVNAGNVGIGTTNPTAVLTVAPPSAQIISSGGTITSNACGTIKRITAAGAVTTSTTNTFTAPASSQTGCCMMVINIGTPTITLDANANFRTSGAGNIAMTQYDAVEVCSTGTYWFQASPLVSNS